MIPSHKFYYLDDITWALESNGFERSLAEDFGIFAEATTFELKKIEDNPKDYIDDEPEIGTGDPLPLCKALRQLGITDDEIVIVSFD